MSNNQFFKVYTADTTVSLDFPFHISHNVVRSESEALVRLVSQEHSHEFMQMLYVEKGECSHETDGKVDHVRAGEIIVVPSFMKHRNDYMPGAEIFTVSFMPSFVDTAFDTPFTVDDSPRFTRFYFAPFLDIAKGACVLRKFNLVEAEALVLRDLFWQMQDDFNDNSEIARLSLHANFIRVLSLLARHYLKLKEGPAPQPLHPLRQHFPKVQQIITYIQENYRKDLHVEQMIERSGLSSTYFRSVFKEITGKSFVSYLNELRIYHAIVLIKKSSLTLSEIAYEVGYEDFQNFHRAFKRIMGVSPSSYRRSET